MITAREERERMKSKRKKARKDFEPEPSPVWVEENNMLKPSPFFSHWWQQVAQLRFGDKERWLQVAQDLGYILSNGEPIGFEYDPSLARASLGIAEKMPLFKSEGNAESYKTLRKLLLMERRHSGK